MPKRRFKPTKPTKKIGKKQLLLPPVMIGVATLAGIIIMQLSPPPPVLDICLKAHNVETFNIYPIVQIFENGKQKFLPEGIGKELKEGKECLHIIHTDEVGDKIHIEYIRPIRLSINDFMQLYSLDNKTISVIDNETGAINKEILTLDNYDIQYSYFSEDNEYTKISDLTLMPPFTKDMVVRIDLRSK
ncbi:MAG TPA: hypothetical protein VFT83_04140 [Nitrososphaeraceae archaeon]|nr:hypothetical protein [Nitrososphaeraceae archaeon]